MVAQDHWRNHFGVEASGNFTVGKDNVGEFSRFRGVTVGGNYKWFLVKGLFLRPELTVYYENHDESILDFSGEMEEHYNQARDGSGNHSTEVGIGLATMIGYRIPVSKLISYDFFTGPYYSVALDQHETLYGRHYINEYNRSSLRWRVGVGVNVWRIKVGASFDWSLLKLDRKYSDDRENNVVNISLGYNF